MVGVISTQIQWQKYGSAFCSPLEEKWLPMSNLGRMTMQYPAAAAAPRKPFISIYSSTQHPKLIISRNGGLCCTKFVSITKQGAVRARSCSWDEEPYQEVLPNGKIGYLDELDVVTFLDPPNHLIPLDPSSYNPASYLWKKIGDIPEERRHRLLSLLKPRLISQAWEIAGTRYDNPKLVQKSASSLLTIRDSETVAEFWKCRTSGGPLQLAWLNFFKKVVFRTGDGKAYGRLISESVFSGLSNSFYPLYFTVSELKEVLSTEQPCDLAYEFNDGILDLPNLPRGFPRPAKHPWPFNDETVIYMRHVGPGVMVGQAWQEGEALQQVPKKLCGEILMVKEYLASQPQTG